MPTKDEINKVIYQSWHRGCKETDILLGDFAKAKVAGFSEEKFQLYTKLIEENDWDIYGWVIGNIPMPAEYHELLEEIKSFKTSTIFFPDK